MMEEGNPSLKVVATMSSGRESGKTHQGSINRRNSLKMDLAFDFSEYAVSLKQHLRPVAHGARRE